MEVVEIVDHVNRNSQIAGILIMRLYLILCLDELGYLIRPLPSILSKFPMAM